MGTNRRHALRLLLAACSCLALLVGAPAASAATLGCSDDARGTTDLSTWFPEMLEATNAHRATIGLPALQLDASLSKASTWKARDLAVRGYFTHDDPAGSNGEPARTPWQRLVECGFTAGGARAENIAAGQTSGAAFVQAWINSPGHRANIEDASMRYVGFGVAQLDTSTYRTYAVQMFSSEPGPAVREPVRVPQEGGRDGSTGADPSTEPGAALPAARIIAGATVSKHRCRGRWAVAGTCYVLTVHGRLFASDLSVVASRPLVATRRLASGRSIGLGSARTSAAGTFTVRRYLRPPARGTRAWLLRNAGVVRLQAPATSLGAAAAATLHSRVRV